MLRSPSLFIVLLLSIAAIPGWANKAEPTKDEIEGIIEKFAAKESEFAKAREAYTYRQHVRIFELEEGGSTRGKFEVISDILFTNEGKRTEKVVRAPSPTLVNLQLTPEDEQDLRAVQPFVLTSKELPNYQVDYLGKEKIDEIDCYVFAVKPKKMEQAQRYFQGQVWVDDQDLQIVKSYGRATGLLKKGSDQQFPKFETWRQQIDGKYWFPVLTTANDTLFFQTGPQRIRMQVKYEEYKQFKSDVKIIFGDEVVQPPTTDPSKPDPSKPDAPKPESSKPPKP